MGVKVDFKVNVPHGETDITENGQYDVSDYAIANVNVAFETEEKSVTITENGTQEVLPSVGKDALSKVVINTEIPIKEEQSKNVEIKENGTISVLPDEGKVLNEVSITTNVPQSGVPEKGVIFSDYDSDGYPHTATIKNMRTFISIGGIGSVVAASNSISLFCGTTTNFSGINYSNYFKFIDTVNIDLPNDNSIDTFGFYPTGMFNGMLNLKTINFINKKFTNLAYCSDSLFSNTGYETLRLKNVKFQSSARYLFSNCKKLTTVIFENFLNDTIPYGCFWYCDKLTQINLEDTEITNIGSSAFEGCSALISLIIPPTVTKINSSAFNIGSNTSKATITMKSSTPPTISSSTFNTSKLNKIYVPSASVEAYKTATNWVSFADYIEADPNE